MRSFIFILFFVCLSTSVLEAQSGRHHIGDVARSIQTKKISVISPDQSLQNLLTRAFKLHGDYEISGNLASSYLISVSPVGGTEVLMTLSKGNDKAFFSRNFSGNSLKDAALRAADGAVSVLSKGKDKGFFASKLAFISKRSGTTEVYVGDLFFKEVKRFTFDRANCLRPELSADGKSLLYTSYLSGFPDIFKVDLISGRRRAFANYNGTNMGATYNPKNDAVAMIISGSNYGNPELIISNTAGRFLRRLTRTSGIESDPSWSPDGSRLVFSSNHGLGKPQLYLVGQSGGQMKRIPTNISGYCAEPDWNPVYSNLIAFTTVQSGEYEVALYDFKKKKSTVITRGRGDAQEACWLRDGRHLVYTEKTAAFTRLVLLDTITKKKTALHSNKWKRVTDASLVYPR